MYLSTIKPSDLGLNTYTKPIHYNNLRTDDVNRKSTPKK